MTAAGRALAVAAALAVATPGPAAALSCLRMTAQDVFHQHNNAAATYVAVLGAFGPLTKVRHDRANDRVIWRGTFTGHTASSRAFDRPFSADVEIVQPLWTRIAGGGNDPDQLGRWLPGQTGIVYLERQGSGFRLVADICRGVIDTDPASVRPTLACLAGRRCPRSH